MCEECPPEVRGLATRIAAYLAARNHVIVGGLHIVIEDENVASDHIQWCMGRGLDIQSEQFARDLLDMPVPYRHMAVQLAWDDDARAEWEETGDA